jgi:hypothetical protein
MYPNTQQQPQQFNSFQQQPSQGLPYNPHAFQQNPIQVNINNIPVDLTLVRNSIHVNLQPYLLGIAVACIDALQSRAATSPLRMFLYNEMSFNNYGNQAFLYLVKTVCDLSEMQAAQGANIESSIQNSVELVVQFSALDNLQKYPGLQQFVDQQTAVKLNNLATRRHQVMTGLAAYQQQKQQPQNVYGGYQPVQQPMVQGFGGFQQNNHGPQSSSWNTPPSGMFSGANQQSAPSNNMTESWAVRSTGENGNVNDWRKPEPVNVQTQQTVNNPAPYSFNQQQPPVVPQPENTGYQITYNHDGRVIVRQGDPGVKWHPSKKFPFDITRSRTCDIYYIIHDDGSMEPTIKKLSKEEQMEREKHYGPLGQYPLADKSWHAILADGAKERREFVEKNFEEHGFQAHYDLPRKKANKTSEPLKDDEIVKDDDYLMISAADEAWAQTDIGMTVADSKDKACSAYVKPALLVTPIVSKTDVEKLIEDVKDSVSLEQCASKLKVENFTIKSLDDPIQKRDRQAVFGKINRLLTRSLNHYLKFRLGCAVTIESFEADAPDIFTYMQEKFPEQHVQALRRDQKQIILNVLSTSKDGVLGSEFDECVREQQLADLDIKCNNPVFLICKEQYMSVNQFSSELGIDDTQLENPGAVSVMRDVNPMLYSMCERLVGKSASEDDSEVYAYYMKTLDDVVFEVQRSAISDAVFIVGLK